MAPRTQVSFPLGLNVLPDGQQVPVIELAKTGNVRINGQLTVGSIQMVDGGSLGLTMDNDEYLAGQNTTHVVERLIGVNSSNQVSIDADAIGVIFGGPIAGPSQTLSVKNAALPMTLRVYGTGTTYAYLQHNGLTTATLGVIDDVSLVFGTNSLSLWVVGSSSAGYALFPGTNNTYDLGTDLFRPRTGYFGTSVVAPSYTVGSTVGTSGTFSSVTVVNGIVVAGS